MIIGRHWIGDIQGCDPDLLRDEPFLNSVMTDALDESGAHILSQASHKFPGEGGVTGLFLLTESHASYHSYPEYGYLAVDFFTCGLCDPTAAARNLSLRLGNGNIHEVLLPRGLLKGAAGEPEFPKRDFALA